MSNYIETAFMQQRTDFMKTLPDRRKRFSIPDGVDMYLDIEYVNDQNEAHRLDVFRPSESPDKELPIIFNVHGGGLIMGCKEFNRYFCARLCKLGYVVFSIEYRLVPEYTFYHQCTDFFQALRYVQDYGNLYYGKTDEIYGVGDNGGAMLLTYCAAMQNNAEMAAAAQVSVCPAPLQALGLISGMFYTNRFDQIGLSLPKYLYGTDYKQGDFAPYVNPTYQKLVQALPPCLLVTSKNDNLHHYTTKFEKALTKYNMPHRLLDFPKNKQLTHAFSVFEPFLPESTQTIQAIAEYFAEIHEQ